MSGSWPSAVFRTENTVVIFVFFNICFQMDSFTKLYSIFHTFNAGMSHCSNVVLACVVDGGTERVYMNTISLIGIRFLGLI